MRNKNSIYESPGSQHYVECSFVSFRYVWPKLSKLWFMYFQIRFLLRTCQNPGLRCSVPDPENVGFKARVNREPSSWWRHLLHDSALTAQRSKSQKYQPSKICHLRLLAISSLKANHPFHLTLGVEAHTATMGYLENKPSTAHELPQLQYCPERLHGSLFATQFKGCIPPRIHAQATPRLTTSGAQDSFKSWHQSVTESKKRFRFIRLKLLYDQMGWESMELFTQLTWNRCFDSAKGLVRRNVKDYLKKAQCQQIHRNACREPGSSRSRDRNDIVTVSWRGLPLKTTSRKKSRGMQEGVMDRKITWQGRQ